MGREKEGEVAGVALLIDASSGLGARNSGLGLVLCCSGAQVLTCSIGSAASFCRPVAAFFAYIA